MPVEGRGLGSGQTQDVAREGRLGNLATPASVQKLQTALHAKAKEKPGYRFYALYDKMYRRRHPGACLCPVPLQPGRAGRGRSGL